jgi:hypothetical protein
LCTTVQHEKCPLPLERPQTVSELRAEPLRKGLDLEDDKDEFLYTRPFLFFCLMLTIFRAEL